MGSSIVQSSQKTEIDLRTSIRGDEEHAATLWSSGCSGSLYSYSGGSYFDDKPYDQVATDYDAAHRVETRTYTYADPTKTTHKILGSRNGLTIAVVQNDTITGGGNSETFVFTDHSGATRSPISVRI